MITFYEKLNDLLMGNVPFVAVTVVDTQGSVPQDVGAKMLVTKDGVYWGTVGGGKIEARVIQEAKLMIALHCGENCDNAGKPDLSAVKHGHPGRSETTKFAQWSLDKDIGMTCGGSVRVYFEAYNTKVWHVTIFGAGHCAKALIALLSTLDCRITCIDPRQEWLNKIPASPKVKLIQADDMPSMVESIDDGAFVLLITMGHSSDKPILIEILRQWGKRQFPYLGVIGSKAKAARLKCDIDEAGLPDKLKSVFHCPMGLPIGGNHPNEIAISIAAQLLEVRDKVLNSKVSDGDVCETAR